MTDDDIQPQIKKLRDEIKRHNYLYYIKNQPEISDREYDALLKKLQKLEAQHPELVTADSPTQKVGGEPIEEFTSVEHPTPMFSMDNTYSSQELRDFDARVRKRLAQNNAGKPAYVIEPKVDGVAINLIFRNGVLSQAVTRGNGRIGDDVTHNARTIVNLPLSLFSPGGFHNDNFADTILEVRGEVYLPFDSFKSANEERERNRENPFANPRNAAAGTLKLLDPTIAATRRLHVYTYEIGVHEGIRLPDSHIETLSYLTDIGLPVNPQTRYCADIDSALGVFSEWESMKEELNFAVDGLVLKVDSRRQREVLGHTTKVPRYMIAYKFGAEKAVTDMKDIVIQVGKSGQLTPVAYLEPVHLAGTTVTRASLHNFEDLQRKDIRVGDKVYVEKAGEIIPQVVKALKEYRTGDEMPIEWPKHCPSCSEKVEKAPGEVYIRCINPQCPAQIKGRIEHFGSRGAMDIDGLGPALVQQLIDVGLIADCGDLYFLEKQDVLGLERIEEKSTRNLINAIDASKNRGFSRVLFGLGIPNVGSHVADVLAAHFQSIDDLMGTQHPQLEQINEIGPVVAESIVKFFKRDSTKDVVSKLKKAGVQLSSEATGDKEQKGEISGKKFVITGSLENYTRKEISEMIKKNGGRVTSSVSNNTDYVIVGDNPGSKLRKARELGVETLEKNGFKKLMNLDKQSGSLFD